MLRLYNLLQLNCDSRSSVQIIICVHVTCKNMHKLIQHILDKNELIFFTY